MARESGDERRSAKIKARVRTRGDGARMVVESGPLVSPVKGRWEWRKFGGGAPLIFYPKRLVG